MDLTLPALASETTRDLRMSLICSVLKRSSVAALPVTLPACWKKPTPEEKRTTRRTGTSVRSLRSVAGGVFWAKVREGEAAMAAMSSRDERWRDMRDSSEGVQ